MDEYTIESSKLNVWKEKYGCANQYICALASYLMTIVSYKLKIITYKEIGAPGNGKYVLDGLNARDKVFEIQNEQFIKIFYHNL